MRVNCDIFIEESVDTISGWEIQLQIHGVTIQRHAHSLSFLQELLDFFVETLNNPVYLDEENPPGYFHHIPDKICDLSDYFDPPLSIVKNGERGDYYIVKISLNKNTLTDRIWLFLQGEAEVKAIEDALEKAIEDWM